MYTKDIRDGIYITSDGYIIPGRFKKIREHIDVARKFYNDYTTEKRELIKKYMKDNNCIRMRIRDGSIYYIQNINEVVTNEQKDTIKMILDIYNNDIFFNKIIVIEGTKGSFAKNGEDITMNDVLKVL